MPSSVAPVNLDWVQCVVANPPVAVALPAFSLLTDMTARIRFASAVSTLLLVVAVSSAFTSRTEHAAPTRHTRLLRSEPVQDSIARVAVTELRLWFSEPLDLAVTRVRLFDASRAPIQTAALARAAASDAPIVVALSAALSDGSYSVEWSTSSKDGHPVRGTFRFSVRVSR
jgi:methionine-rich copper-binding protein CopC